MWLGQMPDSGLGKQDSSKSCSRKEVGFLNRKAQQRMSKHTIPSENNNINNLFLLSSSFFYNIKALPNPKPPQWVSSFHMWSLHLKLRCLSMRFIASRLHVDLVKVDPISWFKPIHTCKILFTWPIYVSVYIGIDLFMFFQEFYMSSFTFYSLIWNEK